MASIIDLDDYVLEDIFQLLERRHRLVCKQVSVRWYNILMESYLFRDDRHILLRTNDKTALQTAMNVLSDAIYDNYTVLDNKFEPNIDLKKFFDLVGTFIKQFEYRQYGTNGGIFASMVSLKYLTLKIHLDKAVDIFSSIKENDQNFVYNHLERLQVETLNLNDFHSGLHFIKQIKTIIPENCLVIASAYKVHLRNVDDIKLLCEIMKEVTKIKYITVLADKVSHLDKILDADDINCDLFTLSIISSHSPYHFLENLQNKYQNIKELSLRCYCLPPNGIEMPKLTDLEIQIDTFSFEYFGALANSFVNLKYFSLETKSNFSWSRIKRLLDGWKNLTLFKLHAKEIENQEAILTFERNEHLTSLKISNIPNLKIETITNISESFPNLTKLDLVTENSLRDTPILDILKAVIPVLAKLEDFTFRFDMNYDASSEYLNNEFRILCEYMSSVGFPIKDNEYRKSAFTRRNLVALHFNRNKMISRSAEVYSDEEEEEEVEDEEEEEEEDTSTDDEDDDLDL